MSDPAVAPKVRAERLLELSLLVGLVAAVLVGVGLSWLAHEMLAGKTRVFDAFVRDGLHHAAAPWLTRLMILATDFGAPGLLVPIGVATALLFHRLGWKRGAALLPITIIGAGLLDTSLKLAFHRHRPTAFFEFYPAPTTFSFPSGHALLSFCFFASLASLLSARLERRRTRIAVWVAATMLILWISISRIYLGVHHPSDVVAGWGVGFVWVVMVAVGDHVAARALRRRRGTSG